MKTIAVQNSLPPAQVLLPRLVSQPAWMLLECGETDRDEIRSLMSDSFVKQVRQFDASLSAELAPVTNSDQLKQLGAAIGDYLAITGLGSEDNQVEFITQASRMLCKLPFDLTLAAIRAAPASCPWPRELVPFVTESVTTRSRVSASKQQTAQKLLEIWSDN